MSEVETVGHADSIKTLLDISKEDSLNNTLNNNISEVSSAIQSLRLIPVS